MRKFRAFAAVVPMLMFCPAPAHADGGDCYVAWADAVTACANSEPCSSKADAALMDCLASNQVVYQ